MKALAVKLFELKNLDILNSCLFYKKMVNFNVSSRRSRYAS